MHVNYHRGETRRFVFQREHGRLTHRTHIKSKRQSWKPYKLMLNRIRRARDRALLRRDPDALRRVATAHDLDWYW